MCGCCVYGCKNRFSTGGVKFYRIPRGTQPFQSNRRRLWLRAIKRPDWSEDIMKNVRVCSAHFISGEASLDSSSPDFVPSVFLYTKKRQNLKAKMERYYRKKRRDDGYRTPANRPAPSQTPEQECSMDHCPDASSLTVKVKSCPEEQQQQHEHEIGPVLKQEEPQPPHIKEEQEEVWTSPWGEQFPGLQRPIVLNLPHISLKIEECTEDGPTETSADVKDIKRPEPASSVPAPTDNNSLDISEPQRKDTEDLRGLNGRNTCKARGGLVAHEKGRTRQKPYSRPLQRGSDVSPDTEEKPLRCSLCWECFTHPALLQQHMMRHGEEKPTGGRVCDTRSAETSQNPGHSSSIGN